MSASTNTSAVASVIPDKFTVFIDLNTVFDKLRMMLCDDSIPMVNKLQAVSNFQSLLNIRMTIISVLLSKSLVSASRSLKNDIDEILDEIKSLIVSDQKDVIVDRFDKLGSFKNNYVINLFRFDTLKNEASEQIDKISIDIVKMLVSASIYVQKLISEYNKFVEEDDEKTFGNIVDLINNYYIVITERNKIVEEKDSESDSDMRNTYLSMLERIHKLVNSDASKDDVKNELGSFISHLIPCSLSTRSMVELVGGVVESSKYSLY